VSSFAAARPAAQPFDLYRDTRIFLSGEVNGRPTPMLLDSGASLTVLDRAFAAKLGLTGGTPVAVQGAGGNERGEIYRGLSLKAGNLAFTGLTVAVMDLALVGKALGRPVPVVLGRDVFMTSVVGIDFDRQLISFAPRAGFVPPAGAKEVKLRRRGPLHVMPIRIGDLEPRDAIFDLGNNGALSLSLEYHRSVPFFEALPAATGMGGGVGGLHEVKRVTLPSVEIAGVRFEQVPAQLGALANGPYAGLANAGIQLFRPFVITLDLAGDRMWLERSSTPAVFSRDRAGLFVTFEGDHYQVRHVTSLGPSAKAGIKVGDRLVAIQGRKVGPGFPDRPESEWPFAPAGTRVEVGLADGRIVVVTLADFY
ncbi:MAG TPA: aspartyl protease family protein, partial [Sphingomicrobium sp.]|nr:aspartyl protease family protein [Sphingomicrobium sp.]